MRSLSIIVLLSAAWLQAGAPPCAMAEAPGPDVGDVHGHAHMPEETPPEPHGDAGCMAVMVCGSVAAAVAGVATLDATPPVRLAVADRPAPTRSATLREQDPPPPRIS